MKLSPGDRVRIRQNFWESMGICIIATEGSIGRVLSFSEYRQRYKNYPPVIPPPGMVRQWMSRGEQFPVLIETVAPLDEREPQPAGLSTPGRSSTVTSRVGDIIVFYSTDVERVI